MSPRLSLFLSDWIDQHICIDQFVAILFRPFCQVAVTYNIYIFIPNFYYISMRKQRHSNTPKIPIWKELYQFSVYPKIVFRCLSLPLSIQKVLHVSIDDIHLQKTVAAFFCEITDLNISKTFIRYLVYEKE